MRTIEEIKAEMTAVQAAIPELSDANSTSQMSFFGLLKNMWAQLVQLVEAAWDGLRADVEVRLEANRVGSTKWYVDQVKKFQMGDSVTIINGQLAYEVIDAAKQIITQAACVEDLVSGRLLIKTVKGPELARTNLSDSELVAVRAYVRQFKFAGVQVDVISQREDQLKLTATVKYDRQVVAADGTSLTDPSKKPIEDAVRAYLRNLPFDSVISWTALTDYMQTVAGVSDFVISASEIAPFGTNAWAAFQRETVSGAGHCVLSAGSVFSYV